jgi:hypothetical protein
VTEPNDVVSAILRRDRVTLKPDEYERLLRNYTLVEQQLVSLRVPESRYSEPALRFEALPGGGP